MEFDPTQQRKRFVGHVMEDEERLRQNVIKKKHDIAERISKRKEEAAERAKHMKMTSDQLNIIEESKKTDSNVDQTKLKEAQQLAAQIEAESFSKFDQEFEVMYKRGGGRYNSYK